MWQKQEMFKKHIKNYIPITAFSGMNAAGQITYYMLQIPIYNSLFRPIASL